MASSWLDIPATSDFSLANIPFGVITSPKAPDVPHIAVAIGDYVLDLAAFAANSGFSGSSEIDSHSYVFARPQLNSFAAMGRAFHKRTRAYIQSVFAVDTQYATVLKDNAALRDQALIPQADVTMHMPMDIGDYTDFYAGLHHAQNCGVLFRDPANALPPNYRHLPVGYHGRASSVVLSGTPIRRPWGQVLNPQSNQPVFQPCARLDFELEMGAFICKSNEMGSPVPVNEAEESIFGVVLMNDWSARDIQAWEMVPLGPFNSKNLGTSISPWIVLADALEPFKCKGIQNTVEPQVYLDQKAEKRMYDINLEVHIAASGAAPALVTNSNSKNLLFSFPQMLAHHTITGCPMRPGDLLGSGTISGPERGSEGSLLEHTKGGKEKVTLTSGQTRTFLEDEDTVIFRGWCESENGRVGFGECRGKITAALPRSTFES